MLSLNNDHSTSTPEGTCKASVSDKKRNSNRPKSVHRDAPFLLGNLGVCRTSEPAKSSETSVTLSLPPSRLPSSPSPLTSSPFLTPSTIIPFPASSPENLAANAARFWRRYNVPASSMPRQFRTPAEWRDVSDPMRILFLHRAVRSLGPCHAFSLNLSDAVAASALSQESAAGWLHKRFQRRLDQLFGRAIPLAFILEDIAERGAARRLHVHGVVGASPSEIKKVRLAFRRAGGEWAEVRQHQCKTVADPDDGWAAYCAKHHAFQTPYVSDLLRSARSPYAPTFSGPWFVASPAVKAKAEALYEAQIRRSSSYPAA